MADFQTLDLGRIMQTAAALKQAQQQSVTDQLRNRVLSAQAAGAERENTQAANVDQFLSSPQGQTATLSDLSQYGLTGIDAYNKLLSARNSDLSASYLQRFRAATAVLNAPDPVAAVQQVAPQLPAQYDAIHGQGAWAKLAQDPAAVKQQAELVRQQAMAGLVDPDKQFQAEQAAANLHFTQQQENARAAAAQSGEDKRSAAGIAAANARAGLTPGGQSAVAGPPGVSGQAYLATLQPQIAAQVKALAEGRMQFPAGFALKSPYWQQMISAVSQYDPSFDAVNYNARSSTRKSFTSGKDAQNVTALNTAIGHAGTLLDQIGGTASHSLTPINYLENKATELTGGAGPGKFKQTAAALASELTTVFRGAGGAEQDVVRTLNSLSENASEDQKKAAIQNAVELLNSRLTQLADKYDKGMGTTSDPLQLLNQHSRDALARIQGGTAPPAAPATPVAPAGGWTVRQVK